MPVIAFKAVIVRNLPLKCVPSNSRSLVINSGDKMRSIWSSVSMLVLEFCSNRRRMLSASVGMSKKMKPQLRADAVPTRRCC